MKASAPGEAVLALLAFTVVGVLVVALASCSQHFDDRVHDSDVGLAREVCAPNGGLSTVGAQRYWDKGDSHKSLSVYVRCNNGALFDLDRREPLVK